MNTDIEQMYSQLMKGFKPDASIRTEWPMKNGIYQQYSALKSDAVCISGTFESIKSIQA